MLGIQIYVGNTGVLSFGHIGFGAIAGYTFAVLAIIISAIGLLGLTAFSAERRTRAR